MVSSNWSAALLLLLARPGTAEFNFEIGRRIHERVSGFITTPTLILSQIALYRANSAFPHDMRAPDRDAFFKLNDAFMQTYPEFQSIYYGLEDGMFAGHGFASRIANYREPGHSGYLINDMEDDMQKYFEGCLNSTSGEILPCEMSLGGKYTECVNDCELVKCLDEESQRDCDDLTNDEERTDCEEKINWCIDYEIKEATNETRRGYISRGTHCINSFGVPNETPGEIVKQDSDEKGNCYFDDGKTLVEMGNITGDFAYCGDDGEVCDGALTGMYISRDYDPRWRGWYIDTKALQVPNWSAPYPFFTAGQIGITFSLPIYDENDAGQNVFKGVLAIDFTFTDITNFLIENYKDTDTTVAIFERDEPHYIVAASTGSSGVKKVLKSDGVTPCSPDATRDECQAVRATAGEINEMDVDSIIRASFLNQKASGFPQDELVSSTPVGFSDMYASQVKSFSTSTGSLGVTELNWQIMIMQPVITEDADTITKGDSLFGMLITVASIGTLICLVLIGLLVKNRKKRGVIVTDWRFLCAFLFSCALLNMSCLSFSGPNSDEMCLVREWLVHFFLVLSLSLLFTKTYRIYKLVDSATSFTHTTITHTQALKMALPLVVIQTLILLVFTFVDPNQLTELIYFSGSDITHRLVCSHQTPAFFITTVVYEGGLVLLGCVLAFKTRNLQAEFNESKQVIFSMYDTAVISTIILLVSNVAIEYQGQQRLLFTLGIFWTTCFAGCVFVLPRTMKFTSRITGGGARNTSQMSRTIGSQSVFSVAAIRERSMMKGSVSSQAEEAPVPQVWNRRISLDSTDGQNSNAGLSRRQSMDSVASSVEDNREGCPPKEKKHVIVEVDGKIEDEAQVDAKTPSPETAKNIKSVSFQLTNEEVVHEPLLSGDIENGDTYERHGDNNEEGQTTLQQLFKPDGTQKSREVIHDSSEEKKQDAAGSYASG